jgi:hypothetical protein
MSDTGGEVGCGLEQTRIALCDRRTGGVIELPARVAAAVLEREPRIRLAYQRYCGMAGQSTAPPGQRGRLIVFDPVVVQKVLAELPTGVARELRAEFVTEEDEPRPEDKSGDGARSREQPRLDRYLRTLIGEQYDPDDPTFVSPSRRRPPR